MPPSTNPPDGHREGADLLVGSFNALDPGQPNPLTFGLKTTLAEFGLPSPSASADYACGRLAALEFASALGVRQARRVLARERQSLLRRCFPIIGVRAAEE